MNAPGRRYQVVIEVSYAGGTLPPDAAGALQTTLETALATAVETTLAGARPAGHGFGALEFEVSRDPLNVVRVGATVTAASPLAAVARLDAIVDRCLLATGLFEEFDVSGKTLHASPDASSRGASGPPRSWRIQHP